MCYCITVKIGMFFFKSLDLMFLLKKHIHILHILAASWKKSPQIQFEIGHKTRLLYNHKNWVRRPPKYTFPYSTYVVHNATNNDVYLKITNFSSILTEKKKNMISMKISKQI